MHRSTSIAACCLLPALLARPAAGAEWTARRLAVTEGFQTPESAAVDPDTGTVYVSNIVADRSGENPYWAEDGTGFIARLRPGGQVDVLRWKESSKKLRLNATKGICLGWKTLWAADLTRVVWFELAGDKAVGAIAVSGAKQLNDMACDGRAVYVSDIGTGRVHRFAGKEHRVVKGPQGVNGITFFKGEMYAVSWAKHDLYELDPSGTAEPKPFGLARHFKGLDGIEVLDDGTFIVSDFPGGKVAAVSADRKTVRTLIETKTPADIGLDRKRLLLYVPLFMQDRVEVYQLKSE